MYLSGKRVLKNKLDGLTYFYSQEDNYPSISHRATWGTVVTDESIATNICNEVISKGIIPECMFVNVPNVPNLINIYFFVDITDYDANKRLLTFMKENDLLFRFQHGSYANYACSYFAPDGEIDISLVLLSDYMNLYSGEFYEANFQLIENSKGLLERTDKDSQESLGVDKSDCEIEH